MRNFRGRHTSVFVGLALVGILAAGSIFIVDRLGKFSDTDGATVTSVEEFEQTGPGLEGAEFSGEMGGSAADLGPSDHGVMDEDSVVNPTPQNPDVEKDENSPEGIHSNWEVLTMLVSPIQSLTKLWTPSEIVAQDSA